jgi:hypothetical protein
VLARAEGHARIDVDNDIASRGGIALPGGLDDDAAAHSEGLEILLPRLPPVGVLDDLPVHADGREFGKQLR